MNSLRQRIRFSVALTASAIVAVSLLAGCVGMRTEGEKRARQDQESLGQVYRPGGERPALPTLDTNAPIHDFLLFAMLNQGQVEAAYIDWAASVQRITVERSLPDPRLTFQSDIADMVTSLMPGPSRPVTRRPTPQPLFALPSRRAKRDQRSTPSPAGVLHVPPRADHLVGHRHDAQAYRVGREFVRAIRAS